MVLGRNQTLKYSSTWIFVRVSEEMGFPDVTKDRREYRVIATTVIISMYRVL